MGTNLTKESQKEQYTGRESRQSKNTLLLSQQQFVPDLDSFKEALGDSEEPLNSYYESGDYRLESDMGGGLHDQTEMRTVTTTKGVSEISQMRSRTTYVDLDQLFTLENRIQAIKEQELCPVFYLGWTQQSARPWRIDKQPNSFSMAQARAVVLHLPPNLQKSTLFKRELPESMLVLVNQGCTCGELLDFFNKIILENLEGPQMTMALAGSGASKIKIKALRSVSFSKQVLYCLDYFLTQPELPIGRLTQKKETHLAPVIYFDETANKNSSRAVKNGRNTKIVPQSQIKFGAQSRPDAHNGDISPSKGHSFMARFSTGGLGITDYELLTQVGKGGFSRVILARQKSTGTLCAMKVISIEELLTHGKFKQIVLERKILSQLRHPCLVNFIEAFRTQKFLHLVLEFCPAGELFYHLSKQKKFEERHARVIIAEIILALEHLHKHNITYRDLKPENIIIDFRGHAKLTDFGLCKQRLHNDDISKSLCGSPEYICPEMLNTGVHTRMVDFYQVGALLYELLTGLPPNYSKDKQVMFDQIAKKEVTYPDYVSPAARQLLTGLLKKVPEARLGYVDGFAEVKSMPFFESIDWQELIEQRLPGPLKPHLSGAYFDQEFVEDLKMRDVKEMSLEWVDESAPKDDATKPQLRKAHEIEALQLPIKPSPQKPKQRSRSQQKAASSFIAQGGEETLDSLNDVTEVISYDKACRDESVVFALALQQHKSEVVVRPTIAMLASNGQKTVGLNTQQESQISISQKKPGSQATVSKVNPALSQTGGPKHHRMKPVLSPMLEPLPQPADAVNVATDGFFHSPKNLLLGSRDADPQSSDYKALLSLRKQQKRAEVRAGSGQMPMMRPQESTSSPEATTLTEEDEEEEVVGNGLSTTDRKSSNRAVLSQQMNLVKKQMETSLTLTSSMINPFSATQQQPPMNFLKRQELPPTSSMEQRKAQDIVDQIHAESITEDFSPVRNERVFHDEDIDDGNLSSERQIGISPYRNPNARDTTRYSIAEKGASGRKIPTTTVTKVPFGSGPMTLTPEKGGPFNASESASPMPLNSTASQMSGDNFHKRRRKMRTTTNKTGEVQPNPARRQLDLRCVPMQRLVHQHDENHEITQVSFSDERLITAGSNCNDDVVSSSVVSRANDFSRTQPQKVLGKLMKFVSERRREANISSGGVHPTSTKSHKAKKSDVNARKVNALQTRQPSRQMLSLNSSPTINKNLQASSYKPLTKSRSNKVLKVAPAAKQPSITQVRTEVVSPQSSTFKRKQKTITILDTSASKPTSYHMIPQATQRKLAASFTEKKLNVPIHISPSVQMRRIPLKKSHSKASLGSPSRQQILHLETSVEGEYQVGAFSKPLTPIKDRTLQKMPSEFIPILNHKGGGSSVVTSPSRQFMREVPLKERPPSQGMPSPGRQQRQITPRQSCLTKASYIAAAPLKVSATCVSQHSSMASSGNYLDVPVAKQINSINKIEQMSSSMTKSSRPKTRPNPGKASQYILNFSPMKNMARPSPMKMIPTQVNSLTAPPASQKPRRDDRLFTPGVSQTQFIAAVNRTNQLANSMLKPPPSFKKSQAASPASGSKPHLSQTHFIQSSMTTTKKATKSTGATEQLMAHLRKSTAQAARSAKQAHSISSRGGKVMRFIKQSTTAAPKKPSSGTLLLPQSIHQIQQSTVSNNNADSSTLTERYRKLQQAISLNQSEKQQ